MITLTTEERVAALEDLRNRQEDNIKGFDEIIYKAKVNRATAVQALSDINTLIAQQKILMIVEEANG